MVAIALTLTLLTVAAVEVGSVPSRSQDEPPTVTANTDAQVAPSTLPRPKVFLQPPQVRGVHRALHEIGRACADTGTPDPGTVAGPLREIETFASQYPDAGFWMDHESGTTLGLLIVVRNLLEACDPGRLPEIDALVPPMYRS